MTDNSSNTQITQTEGTGDEVKSTTEVRHPQYYFTEPDLLDTVTTALGLSFRTGTKNSQSQISTDLSRSERLPRIRARGRERGIPFSPITAATETVIALMKAGKETVYKSESNYNRLTEGTINTIKNAIDPEYRAMLEEQVSFLKQKLKPDLATGTEVKFSQSYLDTAFEMFKIHPHCQTAQSGQSKKLARNISNFDFDWDEITENLDMLKGVSLTAEQTTQRTEIESDVESLKLEVKSVEDDVGTSIPERLRQLEAISDKVSSVEDRAVNLRYRKVGFGVGDTSQVEDEGV